MKNTLWVLLACGLLAVACATEEPVTPDGSRAFVGATLFDGTGSEPISNAVIVVRDGRIVAAGAADAVEIPAGAERVNIAGKTVVPGLINTHGHVSGVLGLEGGHYNEENLLRQLGLYARYGVTAVNSLGGDGEDAVRLRDAEDASLDRARITIAGAVVTGESVEEVQAAVEANAAMGVDFIKIRVDDNLGASAKMPSRALRRRHRGRPREGAQSRFAPFLSRGCQGTSRGRDGFRCAQHPRPRRRRRSYLDDERKKRLLLPDLDARSFDLCL